MNFQGSLTIFTLHKMIKAFNQDQVFENVNFSGRSPEAADYENCTFTGCDFSDSDLADLNFMECTFDGCNLSLTKLTNTTLRETRFVRCKLLGLHFEDCNKTLMSLDFENCIIELCSFYRLKLSRTRFVSSKISEADFTEADLMESSFTGSDLQRSVFRNTNLEGADFRTSVNYSIDPDLNRIKKAKFSLAGIAGLLDRFGIEIED